MKRYKNLSIMLIFGVASAIYLFSFFFKAKTEDLVLTELSALRNFDIEIHTVGELEAERSTGIASAIKGDLGKIVFLVPDGISVKTNDILVKLDPTPFEEIAEDLKRKIQEQDNKIAILDSLLIREKQQVAHEVKTASIEVEVAQFEINKMIYGDGPIEESRLKAFMQKSLTKYEELKGYTEDLIELQAQDFLNPIELKQSEKKLKEEEEAYLTAKLQYESYINHTLPMQAKKVETALKRCKNNLDEVMKSGTFKIAKAQALLEQGNQEKRELLKQLKNTEYQIKLTEIKAQTPGMVVLKEDFRNGQRRKPRLGDVVLRNQTILDLPDLESMLVKTKVREIDLYKIQIETPATVEMDAYPELTFQGKVQSIGVLAFSDLMKTGDEKYFEVILKLDSSDPRLRPGMTARVVIHANQVIDKLTIPVQTLFEFNKKYYCFVNKEGRYIATPIEIGLSNEYWVEIKSGLKENEHVSLSTPQWAQVINADEILGHHR